TVASQFDLSLRAWETSGTVVGSFVYATALFDESTIARMSAHWRALLEAMAAEPGRCIHDLPLLSEAERRQLLLEWNEPTAAPFEERCVHELFAAQARRTPEAIALVCEDQELSYAELDRRAN